MWHEFLCTRFRSRLLFQTLLVSLRFLLRSCLCPSCTCPWLPRTRTVRTNLFLLCRWLDVSCGAFRGWTTQRCVWSTAWMRRRLWRGSWGSSWTGTYIRAFLHLQAGDRHRLSHRLSYSVCRFISLLRSVQEDVGGFFAFGILWLLLLPNAGLCADKARSALPHSVRSGACVFVARNNSLLVAKASVTQKSCSSPRCTSIQSLTFHCLRQTLPFCRTLVLHETGTSSLLAANDSLARKSSLYKVPLVGMDVVVSLSSSSGSVHRAVSLFFVIVVHVVGNLHIFKGPSRRVQRVPFFQCSFVLYMPWIPGEHRRGIRAVECVAAHLRGFEEDSRSEVVFCIDEWSIEFGYHWLMLLMFLTAHLFQFRFVDSEQYCNMALRLRCRPHEFLVVRLLSSACHLFSCELWIQVDPKAIPNDDLYVRDVFGGRHRPVCGDMGGMPGWFLPLQRNSHPHCTCGMQHATFTGTSTYAQKSWCGHPRCDLAPLTTSFGTVGQWERQHLAMAATSSPEADGLAEFRYCHVDFCVPAFPAMKGP